MGEGDNADERQRDLGRREEELARREEMLLREELHAARLATNGSGRGGISAIAVMIGVLLAAVVIWVIYSAASANDDVECASENAQRSLDGLPPQDC